jgi:2-hydroxychromene-2-carboxylate isomerase
MTTAAFHFDYRSPYSYLAVTQLGDVALTLHPFDIVDVMQRIGNTPTTVTCKAKGAYANRDIQRWAARYGVPFARNPEMRSIDARRLLRATLAVAEGAERRKAVEALYTAMWGVPAPLSTPAEIGAVLAAAGVSGAEALAATMDDPALDQHLNAASIAAAELGVFGSPTFVVGGEMFFGNDRLDFLRDALAVAA